METSPLLQEAFQRYLDNRYSEQDLLLIQDRFGQDTDRELLCQLIEAELQRQDVPQMDKRIDHMLYRTDSRMEAYLSAYKRPVRTIYKRLWYTTAAAAAIALFFLGINIWNNRPAKVLEASAGFGQTKQVVLPDSSVVWLNAGTSIEYPEAFRGKERQVNLKEGQAFFQVKHDPAHPFKIAANGMNVTVLGTSFEVKSFKAENSASVTVSTGKVGVLPTSKVAATLTPGQQATLDKQSGHLTTREVKLEDIAAWRENRLAFEKESFEDIAHTLERKYNVQIKVNNAPLLQQKITLRLNNQPLEQVLSVMAFSNNFKYTINGRTVIVN